MTPLLPAEITSILSAVITPVTDNLVGILSIMAGVAGLKFVLRKFQSSLH